MRAVLAGFGGQLARFVREGRYALLLTLLLGATWVSVDVYRNLVVIDAPVAVIDHDDSALSRTLRTWLDATRELRVVQPDLLSDDDARAELEAGRLAAIVQIPDGLSAAVKGGARGTVVVSVDMSNILVGKNVLKAASTAVSTLSAGVLITQLKKVGVRRERAFAGAVPISIDEHLPSNPSTNYAVYLVPSLAFTALHVFLLIVVGSLLLPGAGRRSGGHLVGAVLASLALTFAVGAVFLWGYLPAMGIVPASGARVLLANLGALLGLDVLFALAMAGAIPRPLTAFQLTVIVAMLSLMFSGVTWPTDMFPPALRQVSEWMPFTPFARGLRLLLGAPSTLADLAPVLRHDALLAAAYGGVALGSWGLAAGLRRLRRVRS